MTVLKVVLKGAWLDGSGESRNIFYGQTDETVPSIYSGEATLWMQSIIDTITFYTSSGFNYSGVEVFHDDLINGWVFDAENDLDVAGVDSTDPLPHQIAPLVVARTAVKRVQGKKYIPAITEANVADGRCGAGLKTGMGNYLAAWMVYNANIDITGGVFHQPPIGDAVFVPFTSGRVDDIVATQRRRKQGVGL